MLVGYAARMIAQEPLRIVPSIVKFLGDPATIRAESGVPPEECFV
jgi:hypothetical protein